MIKFNFKSNFTDRSNVVLLLWVVFASYASCWCVVLSCLFLVEMWSPAVVFVVLCHFPKCVLGNIRIKREVGAVKLV